MVMMVYLTHKVLAVCDTYRSNFQLCWRVDCRVVWHYFSQMVLPVSDHGSAAVAAVQAMLS